MCTIGSSLLFFYSDCTWLKKKKTFTWLKKVEKFKLLFFSPLKNMCGSIMDILKYRMVGALKQGSCMSSTFKAFNLTYMHIHGTHFTTPEWYSLNYWHVK